MEEWAKRLTAARNRKGWSRAELSRRSGVNVESVRKYEIGKVAQPRGDNIPSLARCLGVSRQWLERGTGPMLSRIEISGYVGAGEVYIPSGEPVGEIEFAVGTDDPVAAEVRGDSMRPVFRPGDVLIGERLIGSEIQRAIGDDCIVLLESGEGYVKRLTRSATGGFDLISYNDDPIHDARLAWAAPIRWIRRRA